MLISIRNSLSLIFLALCVVQCSTREEVVPVIPEQELREGDVAFRLGRTLQSDAIAATTEGESRYSHVGVVVGRGDSLRVVHIEPERAGEERVKMESVEEFFHPARAVAGCVARYENLTEWQRQVVGREALRLYAKGVGFDHDYSLEDTSQMYCSELVDYVFRRADVALTEQRRRVPLVEEVVLFPTDMLNGLQRVWYYDLRPARHN